MKGLDRKYTLAELAQAVSDYQHFHSQWSSASKMVAAKKAEMESFEREEAKAKAELDRRAAIVKNIAHDLE